MTEVARARAKLKASSQDAVLLLRDVDPVRFDAPGDTYMGGLPKLPPHVDWPENGAGSPLTFIAQIGLAQLPVFANRHLLPKTGVLFFFGEMWVDHRERRLPVAKVIYCDGSIANISPRQKPATMPPMCPDVPGYPRGWLDTHDFWRQVDFRYPLSLHRFKSYYSGPSDSRFGDPEHRAAEELEREAFLTALGEPRHVQMLRPWRYASESCLTWPDWPKSALHARSATNALDVICALHAGFRGQQQEYRQSKSMLGAIESALGPIDDISPLTKEVQDTVRSVIGEFETEYRQLLTPYRAERLVWNAICFASQICIINGRPDLVPAAYHDAVRDRAGWRALHGQPNELGGVYVAHELPRHQMFGHSRNRQVEAETHRADLLLFQLDGEDDLALYPERCGSYYFFIGKNDLQRRDFDKVHFSASM